MMSYLSETESALDSRARRAAKRIGLAARKTRWRRGTVDNKGGYAIVNPFTRGIVHGHRWHLTAKEVIEYCENQQ